jgi:hypothetical protein
MRRGLLASSDLIAQCIVAEPGGGIGPDSILLVVATATTEKGPPLFFSLFY